MNLSLEQYTAFEAEAKKREVSFSRVVRDRLAKKPKFPDDHKCPEPQVRTVTKTVTKHDKVRVFLREGGEGHKGFDIWTGKEWVPAKKSDLSG